MEGDQNVQKRFVVLHISIHSLRMEGDRPPSRSIFSDPVFQSTPSAWRETVVETAVVDALQISIHSLRMEGDVLSRSPSKLYPISIHSLRMEGDPAPAVGW